jgi:hypothetical protein
LIYSHKPQRSGRSIPTNTNNPPQDPPPPPEIPDVLIEESTPPVMDTPFEKISKIDFEKPKSDYIEKPKTIKPIKTKSIKKSKKVIPKIVTPKIKSTLRFRIVSFFKKLFRKS